MSHSDFQAHPSWRIWAEAAAASLTGLLLMLLLAGQPVYEANDDATMEMIAAGVWLTDSGSPLVIYMHPLYGAVLYALHAVFPAVPWHGLMLTMLTMLAFGTLYAAVRRFGSAISLFAGMLVISGEMLVLGALQFTTVAGLCCVAGGLLLLAQHWQAAMTSFSRRAERMLACGLMLAGMLLRLESAILALGLMLPLGLLLLQGDKKLPWVRVAMLLGAVTAFVLITHVSARACYRGEAWDSWWQLNAVKSELIDHQRVPYTATTAALYARQGWAQADADMIQCWHFEDAVLFAPAKMESLLKDARAAGLDHRAQSRTLEENIRYVWRELTGYSQFAVCYYALLFCLLLMGAPDLRRLFVLLCLLLVTAAAAYYLAVVLNRLPMRVLSILFLSVTWSVVWLAVIAPPKLWPQRRGALAALLALILAALPFPQQSKITRNRQASAVRVANQAQRILRVWAASLPADSMILPVAGNGILLPWQSPALLKSVKTMLPAGWLNQSPHQRGILQKAGLDGDLYRGLSTRKHVFMAFLDEDNQGERDQAALIAYFARHYSIRLMFQPEPGIPGIKRLIFTPSSE